MFATFAIGALALQAETILRFPDHGQVQEFVLAPTPARADAVAELPALYPAGQPHTAANRRLLTRRIAIQIAPGADLAKIAATAGCTVARSWGDGWHTLEASGGPTAALEALRRLRGRDIIHAEPLLARLQQKRGTAPTDPLISRQWHLLNTGQNGGVAGRDLNVFPAWNSVTGAGVVIGIIDDGLQHSHPDLAPHYRPQDSYDFNGRDPDPEPPAYFGDDHGTACAGLAAAAGGNGIGVAGVAFEAGLAGLRLISLPVTDEDEADAFAFHNDTIFVKSNSWGPDDNGQTLEGPGALAVAAIEDGVKLGRGGKGTIYLFAAGNGAGAGDAANFDGYANRREVLAIGAVTNIGTHPAYAEGGANVIASAPTDGGTLRITTTDRVGDDGFNAAGGLGELLDPDYSNSFGGTSAAAPQAAGVVALMLEKNPALGWRDVQEIMIATSRKVEPDDVGWQTNGGGFHFNQKYGAGLIDAGAAVALAAGWQNLGSNLRYSDARTGLVQPIPDKRAAGVEFTFHVAADHFRVEHVQLTTDIRHGSRGQLEITLTSPSGTVSRLAERRAGDLSPHYVWTFMSRQCWGEMAKGDWKVKIADRVLGTTGTVQALTLTLWGAAPAGAIEPGAVSDHGTGAPLAWLQPGATVDADFAVTNRGGATLNNVALTAPNPDGFEFTLLTTALGSLDPGQTKFVRAQVKATAVVGTTLRIGIGATADGNYAQDLRYDLPVGIVETRSFSGGAPVPIPGFTSIDGSGVAGKYPAKAHVAGLPAGSVVLDVKLHLAHFIHKKSYDLDALLVSPSGAKMIAMSDVGGDRAEDVDLTLTDAAELPLPDTAKLFSGTFRPANYGSTGDKFPSPAPPKPYAFSFSTFAGSDPSGDWRLYLLDDAAKGVGSLGAWSVEITFAHP